MSESIADLQMRQLLEGPLGGITEGPATITAPTAAVIPLTIKGAAGQSGDLQQWQDSTGAVVAKIINTGDLILRNGSIIQATILTSFNNVGAYLGFAGAEASFTQRTGGANTVSIVSVPNGIGLVVKGAASQTADLEQWQSSAGAKLAAIDAAGGLLAPYIQDQSATGPYIEASTTSVIINNRGAVSNVPLIVKGKAGQAGDLTVWQKIGDGVTSAAIDLNGGLVIPYIQAVERSGPYVDFAAGTAIVITNRGSVGFVPLIVKGMASQSGDLQQWQNSTGVVQASVSAAGGLTLLPGTAFTLIVSGNSIYSFGGTNANLFFDSRGTGEIQLNTQNGATGGTRIEATGGKVGFYGTAPVVKAAAIASPTSDVVGTKAAIDAIRVALTNLGLTA